MKVLHVAMARVPSSGIVRQMQGEQQAATDCNLPWTVNVYVPNESALLYPAAQSDQAGVPSVLVTESNLYNTWWDFRRSFFKWLLQKEKDFDVVLLRYSSYDPLQYWYLSKTVKPVFLVHHTLEGPELSLEKGFANKLKTLVEIVIGPLSMRKAKGQIGVTPEILDYEQERSRSKDRAGFVYPNGLGVVQNMVVGDERAEVPRFIFIASEFFPWHGLDRLLDSIEKNESKFKLDIVGNVAEPDEVRAANDPRIRLHGHLSIEKIKDLSAGADLGLTSFALDRKKMKQACTLKVREYLAMGLPVYSGHDDVFPKSFEFYRNDICDLTEICNYATKTKTISRAEIASSAKEFIDKKLLMQKLYKQIAEKIFTGTANDQCFNGDPSV